MKKIAVIILFVFTFVQAFPVITSLFSDPAYVVEVNDEKGEDKTETQKKYTDDFIACSRINDEFSHIAKTAFQLAEKIQLAPCLEKLTPPPNLC
ncbi:MAG: hypothetical protein ABI390_06705 [Daejeonella sp.]